MTEGASAAAKVNAASQLHVMQYSFALLNLKLVVCRSPSVRYAATVSPQKSVQLRKTLWRGFLLRCILLQFSTLVCWFVFVFKSFYLILFMTEVCKRSRHRSRQSNEALGWQHRLIASREAQLAVLLATNCWRYCRFVKQIREYLDITQSLHSLPLASLSCTRCKNSSELGFHSFA